jgi:hypothetical protein
LKASKIWIAWIFVWGRSLASLGQTVSESRIYSMRFSSLQPSQKNLLVRRLWPSEAVTLAVATFGHFFGGPADRSRIEWDLQPSS